MRLLLDTQVFLWFLSDEARVPDDARAAIESASNPVLVSAVSIWEIAIKASIGRLEISHADVIKLPHLIETAGFDELPIAMPVTRRPSLPCPCITATHSTGCSSRRPGSRT